MSFKSSAPMELHDKKTSFGLREQQKTAQNVRFHHGRVQDVVARNYTMKITVATAANGVKVHFVGQRRGGNMLSNNRFHFSLFFVTIAVHMLSMAFARVPPRALNFALSPCNIGLVLHRSSNSSPASRTLSVTSFAKHMKHQGRRMLDRPQIKRHCKTPPY